MELQAIRQELDEAGYALYAVSYDAVDVLSGFAAKHGITYPLLSDEGSVVIRDLGLLNEDAAPAVAGIPHPGTFVLNADGTIRSKHFYPSYRERDTGAGVLAHLLGMQRHGAITAAKSGEPGIAVTASLDNDSYAWGQRIWLAVELDIPPGLHVYGKPIPEGYYPLEVSVAPIDRVAIGEATFPEARPFQIAGLDEQFVVYEGPVTVSLPLTFMTVDAGTLTVDVSVSFQACSDTDCLLPTTVPLQLTIDERPLVERPTPRPQ